MSFKNKMKNRGISKLDNLVETPDYITPTKPVKKNWNWLKIAIPVTAGLALIIVPISIISASGLFSGRNAAMKGGDKSSDNAGFDPSHHYDEPDSAAPETSVTPDATFASILIKNHINGNYVIEVYDYADGYMEPTYVFENEDATKIINSISNINSDVNAYHAKAQDPTTKRNDAGRLMGINHRLTIKDNQNTLSAYYFSQFSMIYVEESAFDLTGTEAYTIMDEHVEMDYDPDFDESIN